MLTLGLKQAGRGWNVLFTKWFHDHGFSISTADPCLFIYHGDPKDFLTFAIHVDDMTTMNFRAHCPSRPVSLLCLLFKLVRVA